MTFLVAGATGTVGRHVVETLHRAGRPVRALTRRPESATFPSGVEVIGGDLTDLASFEAALDGVVGVHLLHVGTDGTELVRRLEKAGVRKVTLLGAPDDETLAPAVQASGLEWTLLAPTEFMSNALWWADDIKAGRVEEPFVDIATAMVHQADIGAVGAHALMDDGHAGQTYWLTGPERITVRDKIRTIGEAIGREIELVELTTEQAREKMRAEGVPEEFIDFKLEVFAAPPVEANTVNFNVENVTGRPARSFAQWAVENAEAFRS